MKRAEQARERLPALTNSIPYLEEHVMAEAKPIPTDPRFKDMTGQRHGRLTVAFFVGMGPDRKSMWQCRCDCGHEIVAIGKNLRTGNTSSCGCARIGLKRSAETRAKMSKPKKKWTEEQKSRQRARRAAWTPEVKAAIAAKTSASLMGRTISPETRAKISAAHKGRKFSEETIRRMCAAAQRREESHIAAICETNLLIGRYLEIGAVRPTGKGYEVEKVAHRKGNRNWRQRHRCIMERHIGRPLKPSEHVHHLDGDGMNNDLSNLAVLGAKPHAVLNYILGSLKNCEPEAIRIILQTLHLRFLGDSKRLRVAEIYA